MFYRLYKNVDNHYYILVNFKIIISPKILKKNDIFKFVKFFGVQSKGILLKYEIKMYTLSQNKFR